MADQEGFALVEGRHPVEEALLSGQKVREVILQEGIQDNAARKLRKLAADVGAPVRTVDKATFRKLTRSKAPQGVAAWVEQIRYVDLDDIVTGAASPGLVLLCDGIVDPHNLGALIRSAEAAGASGAVIPKHRAAEVTQTVIKASAGAAWKLPIAQVTNLTRAIKRLKEAGYWVVGAKVRGTKRLWDVDFSVPTAIVIGAEGRGLGRLVAESCDILAQIPMAGAIQSLNASVSGALFLFEALRQRSTNV